MSVIIRLQNLAWSANASDIRDFFKGLAVPEGGVHIVGGELGDAFIAFGSDEDARIGMMKTGELLKGIQVTLHLSSRNQMQKVIETARQQATAATAPAPFVNATPVHPTQIPYQHPTPGIPMNTPMMQSAPLVQHPPINSIPEQNRLAGNIMQQPGHSVYRPEDTSSSQAPPFSQSFPAQLAPQYPPNGNFYGGQPQIAVQQSHVNDQLMLNNKLTQPAPLPSNGQMQTPYFDGITHPPTQPMLAAVAPSAEQTGLADTNKDKRMSPGYGRDKRARDSREERRRRSRSRSRDRRRRHRSRSSSRSRDRANRRKRSRSRERSDNRDRDRRDKPRSYRSDRNSQEDTFPQVAANSDGIPGLGDIPKEVPRENLSIFSQNSAEHVQATRSGNSRWGPRNPTPDTKSVDMELESTESDSKHGAYHQGFKSINDSDPNSRPNFDNHPSYRREASSNSRHTQNDDNRRPNPFDDTTLGRRREWDNGNVQEDPRNGSFRGPQPWNRDRPQPFAPEDNWNRPAGDWNGREIPGEYSETQPKWPQDQPPMDDEPERNFYGEPNSRDDRPMGQRGDRSFENHGPRGPVIPYEFGPPNQRGPLHDDMRGRGRGFSRGRGRGFAMGEGPSRERKAKSCSIEMLNIPPTYSYKGIREFFKGIFMPPNCIKLIGDPFGNRIGVALVRFSSTRDTHEAFKRSGTFIDRSRIEINFIDDIAYDNAVDINQPRDRPQEWAGPARDLGQRIRTTCIQIMGLPNGCTNQDVAQMFSDVSIDDIVLELDERTGDCSGSCVIKLRSADQVAYSLNKLINITMDGQSLIIEPCAEEFMEKALRTRDATSRQPNKHSIDTHAPARGTNNLPDSKCDENNYSSKSDTHKQILKGADLLTDSVSLKKVPSDLPHLAIRNFFSDERVIPERIFFNPPDNDNMCEVYVVFDKIEDAKRSTLKSDHMLASSMVTVELVSKPVVMQALGLPFNPLDLFEKSKKGKSVPIKEPVEPLGMVSRDSSHALIENPKSAPPTSRFTDSLDSQSMPQMNRDLQEMRANSFVPPNAASPFNDMSSRNVTPNNFGRPGCVVSVSNVPYSATTEDILQFFGQFRDLTADCVIRRYDELNRPTADARVALSSPTEASKAVHTLNKTYLFNRCLNLSLID